MACRTGQPEADDFDPNIERTIKWIVRSDKDLPPDTDPLRRKPRFDDNIFVEETVVDNLHDQYRYAISRVRKKPL
eukprot:12341226-Heterocapsa_arctica.AAC.1